jgi:hypothetical protein
MMFSSVLSSSPTEVDTHQMTNPTTTHHTEVEDYSVALCYEDTLEPYHTVAPNVTYPRGLELLRELIYDKNYSANEVSIINNLTGRHMSWVIR